MAEEDLEGFELKDEELVDFEGSDYGFGSDEELDVEEEEQEDISQPQSSNIQDLTKGSHDENSNQKEGKPAETFEHGVAQANRTTVQHQNTRDSEAARVEDMSQVKRENALMPLIRGPAPSAKGDHKEAPADAYHKKHNKPELEDGELVELANMPDGSDYEAIRSFNSDKEDIGTINERKRRKNRFFPERQFEGSEYHDRKELVDTGYATGRQFRGRGRATERAGIAPSVVGGDRGLNAPMPGLGGPNFGQGVGRPFMPLDLFAQVPLANLGHGFMAPPGGLTPPGRPDFPLAEAMVHEQLLQCQRMAHHIAQLGGPGIGRPQFNRPMGATSLHPFVGLELMGPGQSVMQLPSQGQDMSANNFGRGQRSNFGEGRGSIPGTAISLPAPRNGRPCWPPAQVPGGSYPRGRGQGRGIPPSPVWPSVGDNPVVGGSLGLDSSQLGFGQASPAGWPTLNVTDTYGPLAPNLNANMRPPLQFHAELSQVPTSRVDGPHGERFQRNGFVQNPRPEFNSTSKPAVSPGTRMVNEKNERQKQRNLTAPAPGTGSRGNGTANLNAISSSLIHLSGPVQKSRVLTVCGLPENTSMSTVVETFEKQGKIMDFRKNEKGDVFTITFSNVVEAVAAKRHLHRSLLAGHRITVEYTTDRN